MSLKAWYPLNGNINNYGVGQLTPAASTSPTYVNGGKLGGQAMSTGAITWTAEQTATVLNNDAISFAFWIKPINTSAGQIFGNGGMSANNNRKFAIFAYPNGNDLHLSWMNDAASATFAGGVWSGVFPTNDWTHCCITYDNPTVSIYINGELKGTTSGASASSSFAYSTQVIHNSANRYLNDFRVYDHCLSPKEVRLISQSLIAHYKLDDKNLETTTNLALYPTPGSAYAPAWDTTKHPGAITVSNWSTGYNSGVSAPTTGYHAYWKIIDNIPTIVFPNLNSEINSVNRWLGISSGGFNSKIGAGKTYTISCDAKASVPGVMISSGLYYYNISNSRGFHDGCTAKEVPTSWTRMSWTYTTSSAMDVSKDAIVYFYGHNGGEGISYVRNIQVELKDHATAYTTSSRTTTILQDCSGYGYHGSVVGSANLNTNSAKYSNCMYLGDARTNYGKSGTFTMPTDKVTISCWFKSSTTGYGDYHIPLSFNADKYELSIDSSGHFRNGFSINGSRQVLTTSHTSILDGKWHMIAATYDGTTIRRYVDGVELTSYATVASGTLAGGTSNLLIGNYNGTTYANNQAYMSDVRIYSTALSADDIKGLYNTGMSILDNGGIVGYEFTENAKSNIEFKQNGIVNINDVSEIESTAGAKIKVLNDGSAWARIFYHNNLGGTKLFTTYNEVMCSNNAYKYSCLYLLNNLRGDDGKFEFLLNYTPLDTSLDWTNKYNRWKQTSNPCEEYKGTSDGTLTATGYEAIRIDFNTNYWGGLTRQNSGAQSIDSCFLSGSVGHSDWYHAIGANTAWNGGIPGADKAVTETELWVRIDTLSNLTIFSMLDDKYIQAFKIYEI